MLVVVIGGSGSGKSERAESLVLELGEKRIYLATMIASGEEGKQRVERHKKLREGKGFDTIECPLFLEKLDLSGGTEDPVKEKPKPLEGTVALIEDIPNLVANEMFEKEGRGDRCVQIIKEGIARLQSQAEHLVIVTGNVSEDGSLFDGDMKRYMECLNECNAFLTQMADRVEEVVCGIPLRVK
ncbi:MAG: bifunctional adenosylcobinamide kinase/adenosylcobinamide-phosphate guanylyltransferase [Lachnospiraceae bacterium]